MKRYATLMVLLAAGALPVMAQDIDYKATLGDIKANIEAGDFASALESTNLLRDFLTGQLNSTQAVSVIEAKDLFAAYTANEQKAKKLYQNVTVIIHGTVTKIGSAYDQSFNRVPAVQMEVGHYGFDLVVFKFTDADGEHWRSCRRGTRSKSRASLGISMLDWDYRSTTARLSLSLIHI